MHTRRNFLRTALGAVGAGTCASRLWADDPPVAQLGASGMVAAADALAMQAGEAILAAGGNAIEAAVVTAAVLGVVEPYASGIGGGGFMVIHLADGMHDIVLDSRVVAPKSVKKTTFATVSDDSSLSGGLPVGVPGAVRHWEQALALSRDLLNGTLSFSDALQPAIQLAAGGFNISETFASILARNADRLALFPDSAALFLSPQLQAGDLLIQSDLANTLSLLAANGADAFYSGPIADALLDTVRNPKTTDDGTTILPSGMTSADLSGYKVVSRQPLYGTYRDNYRLITAGAPASGLNVIEMLNLAEGFPLGKSGYGFLDGNTVQVMIEIMKIAYGDRVHYLGDPAFVTVPTGLGSKDYAALRRKQISLKESLPVPVAHGAPESYNLTSMRRREDGSCTTHLSVIDAQGNMVSYTTTLSELFGSAMVVPGYGFLLNDTLRDFTLDGTGANAPAAGKRPKSGISPFIVLNQDGSPRLVAGAAGGNRIPAIVFSVLSHVLDQGLSIDDAINAPRIVNENRSSGVGVSDTRREPAPFSVKQSLVTDLRGRGQTVIQNSIPFGAAQGIAIDTSGRITKGTDRRRNGEF